MVLYIDKERGGNRGGVCMYLPLWIKLRKNNKKNKKPPT